MARQAAGNGLAKGDGSMNTGAVAERLSALGLRLPAAELDVFAALVADMHAASAFAQRKLPYACEPAGVFALPRPAKG